MKPIRKITTKIKIIASIIVVIFMAIPFIAFAQATPPGSTPAGSENAPTANAGCGYTGDGSGTYCLNINIGGLTRVEYGPGANPLGTYVSVWYSFIIGGVGIIATVMIMWSGFKWLTSQGNSGKIGEAKEGIQSALIGLALAFLSFTILQIINPNLLSINTPGLNQVSYVGDESSSIATDQASANIPQSERTSLGAASLPNIYVAPGVTVGTPTLNLFKVIQDVSSKCGNLTATSMYREGDSGYHGSNQAIDFGPRTNPSAVSCFNEMIAGKQPDVTENDGGRINRIYNMTTTNNQPYRLIMEYNASDPSILECIHVDTGGK